MTTLTSPATIAQSYRQSRKFIDANLQGVEPETARVAVADGGSTFEWVLGHIVYWRNQAVAMLGAAPLWPTDGLSEFRGVDKGDCPDSLPRSLVELTTDLDEVTVRLDRALDDPRPEGDVWDTLTFLALHEAYHAGQLGLLRRAAGLPGGMGR